MGSINTAILAGHLGADAELKTTQGGRALLRLRLATSKTWTDANGEKKEQTDWHTVVYWGKEDGLSRLAEYLTKGRQIGIVGSIRQRAWETDSGEKRWSTEINAQRVEFLDSGGDRNATRAEPRSNRDRDSRDDRGERDSDYYPSHQTSRPAPQPLEDDDIPF